MYTGINLPVNIVFCYIYWNITYPNCNAPSPTTRDFGIQQKTETEAANYQQQQHDLAKEKGS